MLHVLTSCRLRQSRFGGANAAWWESVSSAATDIHDETLALARVAACSIQDSLASTAQRQMAGCAKRYSSLKCCAVTVLGDVLRPPPVPGPARNVIHGHCDEVSTSTQESGLSVLWTPIRSNQPRQPGGMRRRAATRSGSTHKSLASTQSEWTCRFSRCDGSRRDLGPAHPRRLSLAGPAAGEPARKEAHGTNRFEHDDANVGAARRRSRENEPETEQDD